jgi:hypothetical protein
MLKSFYDLLIGGAIMAEFLNPKDLQTAKDIKEAIEKIKKLNMQKENPDRNGMIEALCDAKTKAPIEITALELVQGDTRWMPFSDFSDNDLYRKLSQYQKGLENYCIAKIGKELFKKLMDDENK